MKSLFSLTWRYLLVAALVLNPVAGASAAVVAAEPGNAAAAEATQAKLPPCHAKAVAHHDSATKTGATAPASDHGCGCGNAACEFGACCGIGALDVPVLGVAHSANLGALALPARNASAAAAPPAARMIRPPIG
jgi:hypothetical protein